MQLNVVFRDISRTESLEEYLYDKVVSAAEGFLKYDRNATATVRVEPVRHRTDNRKPAYICEIILKPSQQKGTLKVHKNGEDLRSAVIDATTALRTILRRRSTRMSQHRRHEHGRELENLLAVS
jgi:ribosome-associated translation inhibitor RaiA